MAANDTDSPPTCLHPLPPGNDQPMPPFQDASGAATLVLDEELDATSASALLRFHRRARRAPRCPAAIDLRRTRRTRAAAWATLVKVVRDLARRGHAVTVFAGAGLVRLLELTGLARHARVVIG